MDPRPPRPQYPPQTVDVERLQRLIVHRRFDDHLVRAQSVARFKQSARSHIEVALDPQHGMPIGHDAHRPAGEIRRTTFAPRQDLRTGLGLAALAERTLRRRILEANTPELEIVAPLEGTHID